MRAVSGASGRAARSPSHSTTKWAAHAALVESQLHEIGVPPLAIALGTGFIMVRKQGKLPGKTIPLAYSLEYGQNIIEIQADAILAMQARPEIIAVAGGGAIDRQYLSKGHKAAAQNVMERMRAAGLVHEGDEGRVTHLDMLGKLLRGEASNEMPKR